MIVTVEASAAQETDDGSDDVGTKSQGEEVAEAVVGLAEALDDLFKEFPVRLQLLFDGPMDFAIEFAEAVVGMPKEDANTAGLAAKLEELLDAENGFLGFELDAETGAAIDAFLKSDIGLELMTNIVDAMVGLSAAVHRMSEYGHNWDSSLRYHAFFLSDRFSAEMVEAFQNENFLRDPDHFSINDAEDYAFGVNGGHVQRIFEDTFNGDLGDRVLEAALLGWDFNYEFLTQGNWWDVWAYPY